MTTKLTLLVVTLAGVGMARAQDTGKPLVMGLRGDWRAGGAEVKSWSRLEAGVSLESRLEGAEIYLICPRLGAVTHRCTQPPCRLTACSGPGVASGELKAQGRSIWEYFEKRAPRGVMAGVRGGINEPQEGVLRWADGKVEVSAALAKVFEGEYCLLIAPFGREATQFPLRVSWRLGGEAWVTVPGVRPGMHTLRKATAQCEQTDADPAWVLVTEKPEPWRTEFERTQRQLEALEQRGFGAPASLAILRAMLATYAESLGR